MRLPEIQLRLPDWVDAFFQGRNAVFTTLEDRMGLAVELAGWNVERQTGGPFGAAVFERQSGRLISVGVNLVERQNCSAAHAEIVALSIAQHSLQTYDLGGPGLCPHELVTSTEPCAMCLGAIPWSGVQRLVCGARDEDARAIGFDEGHKPADWVAALEQRGITVVRDVLRQKARAVLESYRQTGGPIYNARANRSGQ